MSVPSDTCADGPTPTLFEGKYPRGGAVGGRLLAGFFGAVEVLIARARPRDVLEVEGGVAHSTRRLRAMLPDSVALAASDVDAANVARARQLVPGTPIERELVYALAREDQSADPLAALAKLVRVAYRGTILSVPREPLWRILNVARGAYLRDLGNRPGHLQHWSRRSFVRWVVTPFTLEAVR